MQRSNMDPRAMQWACMCACTAVCVALTIALDGGVQIARENHAGLLPVVRRLLDPSHLPGDFGIELRAHHHRVFAWMVAGLASVMGETRAFVVLTISGYASVFAATWALGHALRLDAARITWLCIALASGALFLDHGVEANRLLGNGPIMPPTFAHAALLGAIAAMVAQRWNLACALTGAAVLVHLQIGAIGLVVLVVVLIALGIWRRPRAWLPGLVAGLLIATPAWLDLWALSQQGLTEGIGRLDDVAFRMPQHFEFHANRVAAVLVYVIALLACVRRWHRRIDVRARRFASVTCVVLTLVALCTLHYLDYELLRTGVISRIQLLRLSVLLPVLGACALLATRPAQDAHTLHRQRVAFLLVAAVFVGGALANAARGDAPPTLRVIDHSRDASDWADACRWIRATGPVALYVTPPGQTGFAAFARRSTLVEFKVNPDGGAGLVEWQSRLSALSGGRLPVPRTRAQVATALDAAYAQRDSADFARLRAQYGVTHAVLPSDSSATGTVLYRNPSYRIVALP